MSPWIKFFTLNFSGRNGYTPNNKELTFTTQSDDAVEVIRNKMARSIKLGLVPFISCSPIADYIRISYRTPAQPIQKQDPWKIK